MVEVNQGIGSRHSVILRMFNERTSSWDVTNDRLDALASPPPGMDGKHAEIISSMVDSAIDGSKSWGLTTERYVAIRKYLVMIQIPVNDDMKGVIQRMKVGGRLDGVADSEWFTEVMSVLVGLVDE